MAGEKKFAPIHSIVTRQNGNANISKGQIVRKTSRVHPPNKDYVTFRIPIPEHIVFVLGINTKSKALWEFNAKTNEVRIRFLKTNPIL
jgi:hypothetical protein